MLDLPVNWDDEGSPAYMEATWKRAAILLSEYATAAHESFRTVLPLPRISKGPEGSIDIHWRLPTRELLLNVPPEVDEPSTYFGDIRGGGERIEGELTPPSLRKWLLMWLLE